MKQLWLASCQRTDLEVCPTGPYNRRMARPEAAHRVKSYSSDTGYVYQYYFYEAQQARRGFSAGREYVYMVSADRKTVFPIKVFVQQDAVRRWCRENNRELTGTEEYAAAKMRLFQGFDDVEGFADSRPELVVDESNLPALLAKLDL